MFPGVSVVVPVFNSISSLPALVDRIHLVFVNSGPYEVVLVDDGSKRETWTQIEALCQVDRAVRGIRLARNFGQHNALVAGTRAARMPITVTIDDDLQNPPEEIPRLVQELLSRHLDVVYGVPENPEQALTRRLSGRLTRRALAIGLGVDSALDVSSFRAFRTRVRDAFSNDLGTNVSLDALLTWGGQQFWGRQSPARPANRRLLELFFRSSPAIRH